MVRNYIKALNPDACSPFINECDKECDNEAIKLATEKLLYDVIPSYARVLDSVTGSEQSHYLHVPALHRKGEK